MPSERRRLITTAGDLEVVVLYETHELLADLISDEYYALGGSPPIQINFHSSASMWNFYVHAYELIAPGGNVEVDGMLEVSLLDGVEWLCRRHEGEARSAGLDAASEGLRKWLREERQVEFWCSDIEKSVSLKMTRSGLIRFAANFSKHGLLRLGVLMEQLRRLAAASGFPVEGTDLVALREPFLAELESRLIYLSSWLVEVLGALWLALNAVIAARYKIDATNDVRKMRIPQGVTSEALRNLYGSTLVFKSYDSDRISRHIPRVPELLKRRY